jgi:hypothetical protein
MQAENHNLLIINGNKKRFDLAANIKGSELLPGDFYHESNQ